MNDQLRTLVNRTLANPDLPFTERDRAWLESATPKRLAEMAAFRRPPSPPPDLAAAIRNRSTR